MDSPSARTAHPVCASDGGNVRVETGRRARRRGTRRVRQSPRPTPVHDRHHRAPRQGGESHRDRSAAGRAPESHRYLVHGLARGGLGDIRTGLRGSSRIRLFGPRRERWQRPAGPGGRLTPVGVHRGDGRGDRFPARHLARRLPPHGMARGLRGLSSRIRGPLGPRALVVRHPPRGRILRLPRNRATGSRRRQPGASSWLGHRDRRREWCREDHAREAPVQALLTHGRTSAGRWCRPRTHAARCVARSSRRRVPGLLPLRVPRPAHRRARRPPAAERRARGRDGR